MCKSCANFSYLQGMLNTNIVVSLDTRRRKKDGSCPLLLRLGHNAMTVPISLNMSVPPKDWDEDTRVVKKSYKGTLSVARFNNDILQKKLEAMQVVNKLHEAGTLQSLSIIELQEKIKKRLKKDNDKDSFYEYGAQVVQELRAAQRFGTARSYEDVLRILKVFHRKPDLSFQEINFSFLTKFENYHLGKGNEINGLAVYMRSIRAVFNRAIKEGTVEKELYPFDTYKIKIAPTRKRALEWDLLKKIIDLALTPTDICFNARNYFLASYMMYGMNFKDMAFLKKADIADGRISYRRDKTSKLYDIKITPQLKEIFSYYAEKNPDSEFVFPIIHRDTPLLQDRDILWARKRYNKKLKLLADLCGIESTLTTYVSRHSFATQALMQEVPVAAISTMLGHSSLKTTETYLKALPSNILDDYNSKILNRV